MMPGGSDAAQPASLLARRRAALGALCPVLGAALLAVGHANRIERAAHDVVTNARQILHTAAADEHDGVLLQIVADAGDVGRDLDTVGQAHTRDLAEGRVRLLRRLRIHARADSTPLRRTLQRRRRCLVPRRRPSFSHQLTKCRQTRLLKLAIPLKNLYARTTVRFACDP